MKIRIEKEIKFNKDDWYNLYVDDKFITGSYHHERIMEMFEKIKANPSILEPIIEVIKEEVICTES